MEDDIMRLDEVEHIGAPTSLHRQRQSPDMITRYISLMSNFIMIEPSSFEEAVQQPIWVDVMVEEYDSIIKNSAWEYVRRLVGKSVLEI